MAQKRGIRMDLENAKGGQATVVMGRQIRELEAALVEARASRDEWRRECERLKEELARERAVHG